MPTPLPLVFSQEVRDAQSEGRPVVALESTIISHGLPRPENLRVAREVEETVRRHGAVPATIAVLDGRIRIGLSPDELEMLARTRDAMKLGRADLAFAVATGRTGATTVAATMICAALAGIRVFATGGIGGVHHGAETSFDISADLDELARSPVTVVSAGAKAILDLPKTLEILETRGVPVIGFGTDAFPAFWSRNSGLPAPLRLDTPEAVAGLMRVRAALGLEGGLLVANPLPASQEIPFAEIAPAVAAALAEAARAGIVGKAVTPFLLAEVERATAGRSLAVNQAIIRNNAALAARLAVADTALRRDG